MGSRIGDHLDCGLSPRPSFVSLPDPLGNPLLHLRLDPAAGAAELDRLREFAQLDVLIDGSLAQTSQMHDLGHAKESSHLGGPRLEEGASVAGASPLYRREKCLTSSALNKMGSRPDVVERPLAHVEGNNGRTAYNYAQYLPERRKMTQTLAD